MVPELIVLFTSLMGMAVSGYLLFDANEDRRAVVRARDPLTDETELDSFTRHRGVAELIRFVSLVAWFYVALAAVIGNSFFRSTIIWVLVAIPGLITAGSIHSWWAKKQWVHVREHDRDNE